MNKRVNHERRKKLIALNAIILEMSCLHQLLQTNYYCIMVKTINKTLIKWQSQ